jgi:hypothetical protein
MVYMLLLTYADEKGQCWPSHDTLAKILNVQRLTIVKSFETLRDHGFILTKNVVETKPLTVQLYTVPHKLIFPKTPEQETSEVDDFPVSEIFNYPPNLVSSKPMPEHTNSMLEHTSNNSSENSNEVLEHTQIDHGIDPLNIPVEQTTPPITSPPGTSYNPPSVIPANTKETPTFLTGFEISEIYEFGKNFTCLEDIEDDFVKEQLPEIKCLFLLVQDWNKLWGFDLSFTDSDVDKANDLLDSFPYDELINKFNDIAEWFESPVRIIDFAQFAITLKEGF